MIGSALVVGLGTLAAGLLLAALATRLPTLRLRIAVLALGAVLLPLGAVLASGVVMFDSGHDLTVLGVASASATAALVGAALAARSVLAPLRAVGAASERLAAGDLRARAPEHGPAEVAELGRAFNAMAGELERLFDARRQLVANASHDLRTPLASLQAMIEAIEDEIAPPERYLGTMHAQVRHLSALVDDLFELARIDAGALAVELRAVPLDAIVEECVASARASAEARGVRLSARVEGAPPPVRAVPEHVERVLHNLLANALRHTPSDGAVAVVVARDTDGVRVSVEDSGDGIPPELRERAFERFWRADEARTSDEAGAGLGLAIARGLVEAQGGRIWADAAATGGARVSFVLGAAA